MQAAAVAVDGRAEQRMLAAQAAVVLVLLVIKSLTLLLELQTQAAAAVAVATVAVQTMWEHLAVQVLLFLNTLMLARSQLAQV
jgi:hypothetical protein